MIFTDQLQRKIDIQYPPKKIISLVPSQTELLFDLGLEDQLDGITKFCVHPGHLRKSKKIIGGTKNLRIAEIKKLHPDLIIANKEENEKDQIEELARYFPVWISDIKNFDDAINMISGIGEITGRSYQAEGIINKIIASKRIFQKELIKDHDLKSVLYLIWKEPYMSVGADTFIHAMLQIAGFRNIIEEKRRYPEIHINEIQHFAPGLIFLSSEPYPFKEKHISELQALFPASKILLVDGEMFSWYGSRLIYAFAYFSSLHREMNK